MILAGQLIRAARADAGVTQADLARRLATTQSAIARLESDRSDPGLHRLERVLRATGHQLEVQVVRTPVGVDESLIIEQLRRTPAERVHRFEQAYALAREVALAGQRARGDLA